VAMSFGRKIALLGASVVVVLLVAVGIVVVPNLQGSQSASLASSTSSGVPAIVSIDPAPSATNVKPNAMIKVIFSAPLSPHTPMPTLSPPIAGKWFLENPTTLEFAPDESYAPGSTEQLTIPGGSGGILGASGKVLPSSETTSFTIQSGSLLRLQQLLAELHYLPWRFVPSSRLASNADIALVQQGSFQLRWADAPESLQVGFSPGSWGVVTQGAIMAFQHLSGLRVTGEITPTLWSALISAAASHSMDPYPYSYIYVYKSPLPETLRVWVDGRVVLTSVCNTGVGADDTKPGTWPIFLRYVQNYMSGTNLNGTKYHVLVHWINYFHGSVAVHGYPRAHYGFPQSAGCVELPIPTAKVVYGMVHIGTLVTVFPSSVQGPTAS
jgi:peptidoglycan hydrolase-like protein with peptidoglycan-binding domain